MVIVPQPRIVRYEEIMVYIIVQRRKQLIGVVTNIERSVRHCFARFTENIAIVTESVAGDPNVPIPRRSQELGLSYVTL